MIIVAKNVSLSESKKRLLEQKLTVAELAWKDIRLLDTQKNLLSIVWTSIKNSIKVTFEKTGYDLTDLKKAFSVFELTFDPRVSYAFYTTEDRLRLNIWSLLFSTALNEKDESLVFFAPSFQTAGHFIHELSHYNYLASHNMLRASEEKKNDFERTHRSESEKKAILDEITFLKECKISLPRTIYLCVIDQSPSGWQIKPRRQEICNMIDETVAYYEKDTLSRIEMNSEAKEYDKESDSRSIEVHTIISAKLGLPFEIKNEYPKIEIFF